jgi:SAM-dependent methyltransferase
MTRPPNQQGAGPITPGPADSAPADSAPADSGPASSGPVGSGPVGSATMSSALPHAVNYHNWIVESFAPHVGARLLEVGFGYGQYTRMLAPRVQALTALDITDENLGLAAEMPGNVTLTVADITAPELPDIVGAAAFDAIVCLNVLEHIEDDAACLVNLRRCLAPGGRLLLLVPAFQGLYGTMDELAGHYRRYGRAELARKLLDAGFARADVGYFNPVGGLGWLVTARFTKPKTLSDDGVNDKILFFDKYMVPLSRLLTPLARRVFGQSVRAVAVAP